MNGSDTLKIPSASMSRGSTMVRTSFPNAEFWMAVVFLTMTIRGLTLWELGEGQAHGRIGDMVLLGVFGLWFGGRCLSGRFGVVRNRLDLAVMMFVMFYVMSILWAYNVEAGWFRLLKLLRNWMLYILLADYLSVNFLSRYRRIAVYILLSGLFLSLAFVVSISRHGGTAALAMLLQAEDVPSSNPLLSVVRSDQGAGLMMMGFASWLPLCMFMGFSIQPWIRSRVLALGNLVYFYAMGAATLLSASRAAMVGLAGGLAIIFPLVAKTMTVKKIIGGGIILLAVICGAWQFGLQNLVMARFSYEVIEKDGAVSERLDFFEVAISRFKESPLVGKGVASIEPEAHLDTTGYWAVHNVYVQVLAEIGIVGGALFLWILVLWVWYLISAKRLASHMRDPAISRVAVALLAYSIFLFLFFLVGHDLGSGETWIIMGIASALYNGGARELSSGKN